MSSSPDTVVYLTSNGKGKDILAYGAWDAIELESEENPFEQLKALRSKGGYLFGYFSYELKDALENLRSENPSWIDWPSMMFYRPRVVMRKEKNGEWTIAEAKDESAVPLAQQWLDDLNCSAHLTPPTVGEIKGLSKTDYLTQVESLKRHIQLGDIYEANFCQEWQLSDVTMNPPDTFCQLIEETRSPLAAYVHHRQRHLICGSPELFLRKDGNTITSSPIKGTRPRGKDTFEDAAIRAELRKDVKERAENVMITDLVRNDLSKTASRNSVRVEELCRIHTFDTVHQMISKVTSEVSTDTDPVDILSSCFPMGSMTGAPKIRAMELIESHEDFRRGLYSGAVGYFTPDGDFQFNVVIRSIQYDEQKQRASISAGGAITDLCEAELEYEESLLKAKAMMKVMGIDG